MALKTAQRLLRLCKLGFGDWAGQAIVELYYLTCIPILKYISKI